MMAITRTVLLLGVVLSGGCAHVVAPQVSERAADTQSTGGNPVIVVMPPASSRDSEVVIHKSGHDIRTTNIWLGVLLAMLLLLAK